MQVLSCVLVFQAFFTKVPKKVCEKEFIQNCAYLELFWCHQNRINKVSVYLWGGDESVDWFGLWITEKTTKAKKN